MTRQIPPYLDFCTPGQNQNSEQRKKFKPSKRMSQQKETKIKQTTRQFCIFSMNPGKERNIQHTTHKESKRQDTHENCPSKSKHIKKTN